jgi:hypothetical protein
MRLCGVEFDIWVSTDYGRESDDNDVLSAGRHSMVIGRDTEAEGLTIPEHDQKIEHLDRLDIPETDPSSAGSMANGHHNCSAGHYRHNEHISSSDPVMQSLKSNLSSKFLAENNSSFGAASTPDTNSVSIHEAVGCFLWF